MSKLLLTASLLTSVGVWTFAQKSGPPPGFESERGYQESQTRVISPTVLATWIKRVRPKNEEVELVVLWRGKPGWFLNGPRRSSASSVTREVHSTSISYGGLDLVLEFNSKTRTATVQGRRIDLNPKANVILVDNVGNPPSRFELRTISVVPELPQHGPQLERALGSSSEIVGFLQCDVALPNPSDQRTIERICRQITGK